MAAAAAVAAIPPLFISHGGPSLALDTAQGGVPGDEPSIAFLEALGRSTRSPRPPRAILIASAHYSTRQPTLTTNATNSVQYDFGMPMFPKLYQLQYAPPGAPAVAQRAAELLRAAGHDARLEPSRQLDHGAWVPALRMWPEADIPILQLGLQPHLGARHYYDVGRALAPLTQEGVLVLGSGAATHDLRAVDWASLETSLRTGRPAASSSRPPAAPYAAFEGWLHDCLTSGRCVDELIAFETASPPGSAQRSHPTTEHLLPLFIALGAAAGANNASAGAGVDSSSGPAAEALYRSWSLQNLSMAAYRFPLTKGGAGAEAGGRAEAAAGVAGG